VDKADREALIRDLVDGQYSHPVRIVAFNTAEGWSRDVTMDIADELRRRYVDFGEVPASILDFMGQPALMDNVAEIKGFRERAAECRGLPDENEQVRHDYLHAAQT
jgi:hypothetical protein